MSNASIIKKSFKELLKDYQPHTRVELFEHARKQNIGFQFSEGMLTGALKTLTETGSEYACVSRATYQRIGRNTEQENYMDDVFSQYSAILRNSIEMLEHNIKIDPFKLMEMSVTEKEKMYEIQRCIGNMKYTLEKISQEKEY